MSEKTTVLSIDRTTRVVLLADGNVGETDIGFSQQEVAEQTGIPRSAISDIERGGRKVDSLELQRFSRLYRRPVAYLLGEEDSEPEHQTVQALKRAVTDLTEQDQKELLRFAKFLRHSARVERRKR
jgi:transcriptional regulator with XRE-family HTH domain